VTATKVKRRQLVIRCTGRTVNPISLKPQGRVCGKTYRGPVYRSKADWILRARAAGWRVSPLTRDGVNAMCPTCSGGTSP